MLVRFSQKYQKTVYDLNIGEYVATTEKGVLLSTVLGPCIAVCVVDKTTEVVGMNHFMVPGKSRNNDPKYGFDSMNSLLAEMESKGAEVGRLEAKIFGGAAMFNNAKSQAVDNVRFVKDYLAELNIDIMVDDTGTGCARRLFYCSDTHRVFLRRFGQNCPLNLTTGEALVT